MIGLSWHDSVGTSPDPPFIEYSSIWIVKLEAHWGSRRMHSIEE